MISACWFDFIVSRKALIQQLVVAVFDGIGFGGCSRYGVRSGDRSAR